MSMNLFGETHDSDYSLRIGRLPSSYERDTTKARELASEQARLGRLAVWQDLPNPDLLKIRVVAIVLSPREIAVRLEAQGTSITDVKPGATLSLTRDDFLTHPTSSTDERDLWALREAIRKADGLEAEASGE